MSGTSEDMLSVIGDKPGLTLGIYAAVGIAVIIFFVLYFKKSRDKNREATRKELQYYADNAFTWVNNNTSKSGSVTISGDSLYYSRGPKSIKVDVYIQKNTVLTPASVGKWFENRNYNQREENAILNDIKTYLVENRICKTVEIKEDSETSELYDSLSADN